MKLSTRFIFHALLVFAPMATTTTGVTTAAFVSSTGTRSSQAITRPLDSKKTSPFTRPCNVPAVLFGRQRRSVAHVQTMGLFGLGVPEIALIIVALAFLLGPEALANLAKDTGKAAGEFKNEFQNIPDEFKKGLDEGEIEARSRKAKRIKAVPKGKDEE